jgi:hypothetical protein
MVKTLLNKIGEENAQEKLVKYFVYKETELLGKNKQEINALTDPILSPNYLIYLYNHNPLEN